jgi:hypothetical protein
MMEILVNLTPYGPWAADAVAEKSLCVVVVLVDLAVVLAVTPAR